MFDEDLLSASEAVIAAAQEKGLRLATAESCTGGLIIGALTEIPGASSVVDRGFVTYSNEAKMELLGVPEETIASYGAVSAETVEAMAEGALARSNADVAVSVSGIAGPGGGSTEKPVGLVLFGIAAKGRPALAEEKRFGAIGRGPIRRQTVLHALFLFAREIEAL